MSAKSLWLIPLLCFTLVSFDQVAYAQAESTADIEWSPDGVYLAVAYSTIPNISLFDAHGELLYMIAVPISFSIITISWASDSRRITVITTGEMVIVDAISRDIVLNQDFGMGYRRGSWQPGSEIIAISGEGMCGGEVSFFDAASSSFMNTHLFACDGEIADLAWNFDGTQLAAVTTRGAIFVWDYESETTIAELAGTYHNLASVWLSWSPDGRLAVQIISLYIFDVSTETLNHVANCCSEEEVTWSYDGVYLAGASVSGVYVWETATARLVYQIPERRVFRLDWHPSEYRLAYDLVGGSIAIVDHIDTMPTLTPSATPIPSATPSFTSTPSR